MNTEQETFWLNNCLIALKYWKTVPDENVCKNLAYWHNNRGSEHTCGTVACFGGWLPAMPEFREMGVRSDFTLGGPIMQSSSGWPVLGSDVAFKLFGNKEMFEIKYDCSYDMKMPPCYSDKAIVTNRLNCRIKELRASIAKKSARKTSR